MKNQTAGFIALILVLFLDGFGQGVIYPVLATSLEDPTSHVIIQGVMSLSGREMLYGLILAIYFFTWFFGAAILGDISDNVGRKKALLVVLGGMVIGNAISALAFIYGSVWLLILGRVVVGFTAGSQAIAQAAIADISSRENQARNTGFVLFGVTMGFVVGPLVGGYLSDPHIVSWFSDATPLFFAGLLSLLNVFLIMWLFRDTRAKTQKHPIRFSRALTLFAQAMKHRRIRNLILTFLLMQFGWVGFFFQMPIYWIKEVHGHELGIAYVMAWMGLGFCASTICVIPWLEKLVKNSVNAVVGAYFFLAVFIVVTIFVQNHYAVYSSAFFASVSIGTGYTFLIKVFSSHASEDEQGWVMGVMNSAMVLATGISSLVCGYLISINVFLPFVISVIFILLGIVLMWLVERVGAARSM